MPIIHYNSVLIKNYCKLLLDFTSANHKDLLFWYYLTWCYLAPDNINL